MVEKTIGKTKDDSNSLDNKLIVSLSPHIRSDESVRGIMGDVIIALIPAMIASIYYFGFNAFKLILITTISAVCAEAFIQKLFKKPIRVNDLSAVVTGILLALNLPAGAPWWMAVFGAFFGIIVIKEFFGGIGSNFMNPALGARAALVASWPSLMATYTFPDAVSSATPLQILKEGSGSLPTIQQMFIGNIGGVIGETSAALLLIGGVYLVIRKVIDWKVPTIYIGTTALMLLLLGVDNSQIIYHILGGGLMLGAIFMATDYSSSPVTSKGKIIFAIGCGLLTALFRVKGNLPEGVTYAILIMNVASPLIEKLTKPKVFGEVK
ncbi:MAG: RnfABCDGE type electron transport complex subunit D [Tissierellales bacterium]|nr:RnfABCDGE type electron transport complex subunit D [Tissierellales bacterium]